MSAARLMQSIAGALTSVVSPLATAAVITYSATLSGPAENPPNASAGTGFATVTYDSLAHTLAVDVDFSGLLGTTTVAHIHCCVDMPGNVGVATYPGTFPGFPVGATSGSYDFVVDLTTTASYTSVFLNNFGSGTAAGAEAALIDGLNAGRAYFNIHTSEFSGGEIRGFLAVPEPRTLALVAIAGVLLIGLGRRRYAASPR